MLGSVFTFQVGVSFQDRERFTVEGVRANRGRQWTEFRRVRRYFRKDEDNQTERVELDALTIAFLPRRTGFPQGCVRHG